MAKLNERKRSLVKHQTRAPQGKRGGFRVGAKNASTGAYIGGAKKHKADLIHKANVKKAYAKVKKQEGIEEPHTMQETTQDLGRFVPQHETPDSAAPTQAPPPKASAEKPTKKKLPYFYRVPKETEKREPQAPPRTRDEAVEQRRERHALWNKKSPSHLGRQRGQPDLGARMAVMLDKIKHT